MIDKFGFGTWGLSEWGERNYSQDVELINLSYQNGIKFFDTAPVYGRGYSERLLRQLPSDSFIATKIPGGMNRATFKDCYPVEDVLTSIEESISRIGKTPSLIQFHNWNSGWIITDYYYRVLQRITLSFGIKHIGVSMPKVVYREDSSLIAEESISYFQIRWNINDESNMHFIKGAGNAGKKIIARSIFEQGTLVKNSHNKKSISDLSIDKANFYKQTILSACALNIDKILIGMTKKEQLMDLLRTLPDEC